MTIYILAKIWQGGKVEPIEAWKNEDDARHAVSKLISLKGEIYHIAMFTVELKDK